MMYKFNEICGIYQKLHTKINTPICIYCGIFYCLGSKQSSCVKYNLEVTNFIADFGISISLNNKYSEIILYNENFTNKTISNDFPEYLSILFKSLKTLSNNICESELILRKIRIKKNTMIGKLKKIVAKNFENFIYTMIYENVSSNLDDFKKNNEYVKNIIDVTSVFLLKKLFLYSCINSNIGKK